jgi:hypothetical protein
LPLKLVFVIERIHDQPAALTIESLPPLNHEKRRRGRAMRPSKNAASPVKLSTKWNILSIF